MMEVTMPNSKSPQHPIAITRIQSLVVLFSFFAGLSFGWGAGEVFAGRCFFADILLPPFPFIVKKYGLKIKREKAKCCKHFAQVFRGLQEICLPAGEAVDIFLIFS